MQPSDSLYKPTTDKNLWSGRSDAKDAEYLFQIVNFLDLNNLASQSSLNGGYALIGFCCDAGVVRNLGRAGAKDGPRAFRQAVASLPLHNAIAVYDAGDVICQADDLESAQAELGLRVKQILQLGLQPVVIGGGHETAFGHYQGINSCYSWDDVAILNFDAHFDLRDLLPENKGSSGTPFRQIQNLLADQNKPLHYYCAGIQKQANTSSLFAYADNHSVNYLTAAEINRNPYDLTWIKSLLSQHNHFYVTVCLDVFKAAIAPGVSAPQPLGIDPDFVLAAMRLLKKSKKVISFDIVELAPNFDIQEHTAKLASSLFFNYCML